MAKNVVLCLDGTGNQLKASANTNVLELYSMLDLSNPDRQVAYYDPGVGTMGARGAWSTWGQKFTRLLGLIFGFGIKENLEEALTFLIHNYEPGDKVFLFGFSRGAFTARGLTGLTYRAGVMRQGSENLVPYLVTGYTKGDNFVEEDWDKLDKYAETFSVTTEGSKALPINFLGLWDSVKALGILRRDPKWPYTRQLPNARHVFHAVSIDERRRPYHEYLVNPLKATEVRETWFAGVHSDVGGGFDDATLSRITLKWMVDRALDHGLLLAPDTYTKKCTTREVDAKARIHRNGWIWGLLTFRRRTPTARPTSVHSSVRTRMISDETYELPVEAGHVEWDDPNWLVPHPQVPKEVEPAPLAKPASQAGQTP